MGQSPWPEKEYLALPIDTISQAALLFTSIRQRRRKPVIQPPRFDFDE
jgi:hypothetical protein